MLGLVLTDWHYIWCKEHDICCHEYRIIKEPHIDRVLICFLCHFVLVAMHALHLGDCDTVVEDRLEIGDLGDI